MNLREFDLVQARLNPGDEPRTVLYGPTRREEVILWVSLTRSGLGTLPLNSREAELHQAKRLDDTLCRRQTRKFARKTKLRAESISKATEIGRKIGPKGLNQKSVRGLMTEVYGSQRAVASFP
jgi:hypothetical protein